MDALGPSVSLFCNHNFNGASAQRKFFTRQFANTPEVDLIWRHESSYKNLVDVISHFLAPRHHVMPSQRCSLGQTPEITVASIGCLILAKRWSDYIREGCLPLTGLFLTLQALPFRETPLFLSSINLHICLLKKRLIRSVVSVGISHQVLKHQTNSKRKE